MIWGVAGWTALERVRARASGQYFLQHAAGAVAVPGVIGVSALPKLSLGSTTGFPVIAWAGEL